MTDKTVTWVYLRCKAHFTETGDQIIWSKNIDKHLKISPGNNITRSLFKNFNFSLSESDILNYLPVSKMPQVLCMSTLTKHPNIQCNFF